MPLLDDKKVRNFKLTNRFYCCLKYIARREGRTMILQLLAFCNEGMVRWAKKNGGLPTEKKLQELLSEDGE